MATTRRSWIPEERAEHCRQIAHLGGQETVRRYGTAYMRAIAAIGFATTCGRYYGGSRAHARAALILRRGHFRDLSQEAGRSV